MQQRLSVYIGERSERVGTLVYDPARPSVSQFCYADSWVSQPNGFAVSPELPLLSQWIFLNDAERIVRFRLLLPILNRTVGGGASSSGLSVKRVIVGAFQRLTFYLA